MELLTKQESRLAEIRSELLARFDQQLGTGGKFCSCCVHDEKKRTFITNFA